ncbi:MAG: PepSY domain-containing protein [Bacteroidales bacterium]|nr:PepSY domain-containing protein [Bacteroidales bacterium]
MSRKKFIRRLRKYHKWPSIVLSIFILVFALSGIVMNHRELFSGVDVSRKLLLEDYQYTNWNNAAVKSACRISPDSILVYGNIGVWLTDSLLTGFTDFNAGFPNGIDNRKIYKIQKSRRGNLYAGTLFGMYRFDGRNQQWHFVDAPFGKEQVLDMLDRNDSLYVLTRSFLFVSPDEPDNFDFQKIILPPPVNYDNKEGLFKTLWVIHSGEIGGFLGKLVVDFIGLTFIFLTITGLIYWLFPKWIKQQKRKEKAIQTIKLINRFSLKWHNKTGIWVVAFLLITTITGMFLRPPLLITIANASVGKIPFTLLDTSNPWYDKLRRIMYDDINRRFVIGTNQGIYFSDDRFASELRYFAVQPPLSVMGINVFDQVGKMGYLVGSFNGLYLWNPDRNILMDFLNPGKAASAPQAGSPLGEHMTAGLILGDGGGIWHFDYNRGAETLKGRPFPPMPVEIIQKSPMSLWNLALEFHTARYYQFMFSDLYILFIPLFGLTMILILITGIWIWWKRFNTHPMNKVSNYSSDDSQSSDE